VPAASSVRRPAPAVVRPPLQQPPTQPR
jgi:hypothetical protein